MSNDPALLMDKAAAQLAATLQDGLQKMSGHNHITHSHERLKDLTSIMLNGDQDTLPKLCAPELPLLKGAEAPSTNGTHQHNCTPHTEHELKEQQPLFEQCCANGTSLATATEGTLSAPEKRRDSKKRRGGPHKPNLPAIPVEPLDLTKAVGGPAEKVWLLFLLLSHLLHVIPSQSPLSCQTLAAVLCSSNNNNNHNKGVEAQYISTENQNIRKNFCLSCMVTNHNMPS